MLHRPGARWLVSRRQVAEEHRADSVTLETGFHSAKALSGPGSDASGTNVGAMNVSGKITMKLALLTTSGLGASSPTYAMTQEKA